MRRIVIEPWVNEFLDKAETFPEGKYKDQVDSLSGAFNKIAEA